MPLDEDLRLIILEARPLMAFSLYTQTQADTLKRMRDEIEAIMDRWNDSAVHDWQRAYDFFWFWTLGAYEVLRTMDQHNSCFVPLVGAKVKVMKRQIAALRMPFAKQEFERGGGPIGGQNSVISVRNKSFRFRVAGTVFDVRDTMASVRDFLGSITRHDILSAIPVAPTSSD
ncbi:hypothetical protein [Mesorhizobium sp.]|uniref:hypothetical protein n=1 Tax=Mesorhizobium sp. TaxID=1871066 RepID=UPI000FE7744C|nr:hypothetical protein [Mesorhizobium sp.]RWA59456.1 MAG: hypothetical protein EOQ27_26415 [Mesorhizobium sp.]